MQISTKRLLLLAFNFSISIIRIEAQTPNALLIGKIESIDSHKLNEKRTIWIHVPESSKIDPKKKFPVVYLFDAERNFSSVESTISFLSSENGNNFWPELILVGLVNTNRTRDLTPTHVFSGLFVDSVTASVSGGGENLMSFIEQELIPHIDSAYPTTGYRILIGHSLGGLMVINAFQHHKSLFRGYVAIDPSMWWDNQKLLKEVEGTFNRTSYSGISLFLAMAHTQPGDMDTMTVKKDTTSGTIHARSILLLANCMMATGQNGLQVNFKYYDNDTHGSVPLIATYDALHFIFKEYPLVIRDEYYQDDNFSFTKFLISHYEDLASRYDITDNKGKALLPPETVVNNLAYYLFNEKKQFDRAEEMFAMNIKNYPA
ncbi:MAG TPA: alpha/beta hydrolase-fold protein, partial [Puia sp.]|nr:alpha/beta hydrolase-fold protein [Puia sp.]